MIRRIIFVCGAALLTALMMSVLFAAGNQTVPPFKITAKVMRVDLNEKPSVLSYDGDVSFTSPLNTTLITCQHLLTNASSLNQITSVRASERVVFSMVVEPKEKGKPTYKLNGKAEVMTYSLAANNRIVRLLKENGVQPSLIITDLTSNEKTDLTGSGDIIEYNLDTRKLEVKGVTMDSPGSEPHE